MNKINLSNLNASWTKYHIVKTIDVISSIEEIKKYINKDKEFDEATLRHFLGMNNITDQLPNYWIEIQKFPEQKRLFALISAIFTHHETINLFASKYSSDRMNGLFKMEDGKKFTNIRSALVESGAASNSLRRKKTVEYNLSPLFEKGEVGTLFKQLLEQRLKTADWDGENFYDVCIANNFHKVLGISVEEFQEWTAGESLIKSQLKYNLDKFLKYKEIKAYKVNQWLKDWDDITFSGNEMRKKPNPYYLMFKMDARLLKRLSGVHRRRADKTRSEDNAVQRTHNESRSSEIHNYIHGGFPWSTISKSQRESEDYKNLKMPGILPTAIIANILGPDSKRGNNKIDFDNQISIDDIDSDFPTIKLPEKVFDETWNPELKPLEIIDGQHRLWAFDEKEVLDGEYELPVIAYFDLDRAWQAYLFYTINIKPVKINTSLGYDLYPLLRTQEWLENSKDGLMFYRENRAQELVEALWSYKESPWKNRIKMLGEGQGNISQAAFIRALTSSFLKKSLVINSWGMGGLFSGIVSKEEKHQVINWNRSQQAAFLILIWDQIKKELDRLLQNDNSDNELVEPIWAKSIREKEESIDATEHPAFFSKFSFLSRDQGVRGISMFANDIFFTLAESDDWDLNNFGWSKDLDDKFIESESIDLAINQFKKHRVYSIIQSFANEIIKFDWRTPSSDFSEQPDKKLIQIQYKGGSGYKAIWNKLIEMFLDSKDKDLSSFTNQINELKK